MLSTADKFNIIYYILLISLIGSSVLWRFHNNLTQTIKQTLLWVIVLFFLITLYSFRSDFSKLKQRFMGEIAPSSAILNDKGEIEFRVASDGHFYINTLTNGKSLRFMLDTGASDVVIPISLAQEFGYKPSDLKYTKIYNTANGTVRGAPIKINRMEISGYIFNNINASINEVDIESPLLGMSFLKKLSSYEVRDGILILKP